jgi:hypothetical protein
LSKKYFDDTVKDLKIKDGTKIKMEIDQPDCRSRHHDLGTVMEPEIQDYIAKYTYLFVSLLMLIAILKL